MLRMSLPDTENVTMNKSEESVIFFLPQAGQQVRRQIKHRSRIQLSIIALSTQAHWV